MDEPPSFNLVLNIFFEQGLAYPFLLGIIVLFCFDAFLSACESALFSLSFAELDSCRKSSNKNDRTIGSVLANPHLLHITFLISQFVVKITIVTSLTFFLLNSNYKTAEIILAVILTSLLFLFFGEMIPKVYGRKNSMAIARSTAKLCSILISVFNPVSSLLLSLMKRWENKFVDKRTSAEELSEVLEMATNMEVKTEGEKDILQGIVNFGTLTVKQVMRSRLEISAVSGDLDFTRLMQFVNKSGFSRIPVYGNSLDNIDGVLYIKDLLPFLEYPETYDWKKLLRPVFFVPETKKIDLLLKDFQEKRIHMAVIIDDHKIVKGLVTLEDLIEEIIGEINDEFDEVDFSYKKIDEKTFIFDGRTSVFDLCIALDVDFNTLRSNYEQIESVGDLIFALSGDSPKSGDEINYEQFTFVIETADRKRIKRVRVKVHAQA